MIIFQEDIINSIIIVLLIFIFTSMSANKLKISQVFNLLINTFIMFCTAFKFNLEQHIQTDATFYYRLGLSGTNIEFGTNFIGSLSGYLSNILNLGFLPIFILFSSFSVFAIQIVYNVLRAFGVDQQHNLIKYAIVGIIIISIGFWGAGLNKEGVAFLGIALFCSSMKSDRIKIIQLLIAIFLISLARPHIGVIALAAVFVAMIFGQNARKSERIILSSIAILSIVFILPFVVQYIGIGTLSQSDVVSFTESKSELYADTSGYINIRDLSLPIKVFSYIFRPFVWEARSPLQLASSIINLILLALMIFFVRPFGKPKWLFFSVHQIALAAFFIVGIIVLATTTPNLGISNRQKWMFVIPMFVFLIARSIKTRPLA